jgi:CheY-like chemotaxis protein
MSRSILVVDEEPDIRMLTRLILESTAGWEVIEAESGAQCLSMAATHAPDAILLDVRMPEMDGSATFRRLQGNPLTRRIPVLFFTAKAGKQDLQALKRTGVAGLLTKPFNPDTLARDVGRKLGWPVD